MKFKKILLRNIGAYYGQNNELDFSTSSEQNVILIGGKNGAGKTTLLESIRVALFGCISYGFMTENEAYFNKIQSLFNRKARKEHNSHYQIILDYESVENFLPVHYTISRVWNLKGTKINETFSVKRDGRLLDERETDNYQNRLREEIPLAYLSYVYLMAKKSHALFPMDVYLNI
ncbi:ATP-binding protein [Paenibacillus hexagrammi]|uniref:ATP-binding protein n=1 Tax=Paenibacillus hexagrammi TaxID=2908839 RepID=A0ABY3SGX2_9BACL|nr:ATP-binding protein [Paenibacillus sp. YPD9-1]UJF32655.1 ATP-binding protein [Paenibacillus sp. YPD9-1]